MTVMETHLFYPLLVSLIAFTAYSLYTFFKAKAKKLKLAEDFERVSQIKKDISTMMEERNIEQNKQLSTFVQALDRFNQSLSKVEKSTTDIINLSKKLNDDVNKFHARFEKIEKRIDMDYKLLYKMLENMSKQLIKMQTTHNFCHPEHQIKDHDH